MLTIIAVRKAVSPLIALQIQEIKKAHTIKLDPASLEAKADDSPMVKKIKEKTRVSLEHTDELLADHAVDMIHVSIERENKLVTEARELRRRAAKLLNEARNIHNGREFLMEKSNVLPLALSLQAVNPEDVSEVTKHVQTLNVPDYFASSKQKDVVNAD